MMKPAESPEPAKIPTRRVRSRMRNLLNSSGVVIALLGMMAGVIAISVLFLMQNSLRLDEAQSLYQTNRTYAGLLQFVAQDVHVPLYHTLLHYWLVFFGNSVEAARSLSLVFFVLTIPATYLLATYATKRRSVGLFSAFLVAISPFMNWYGTEARMYVQLVFFTVVHQYFFLKIYREAKPDHWLLFTLTAILGVYTHYFFFFVLLTEVLFYLWSFKRFAARKSFRKFVISGVAVAAAFAPWVYYFIQQGFASGTQPKLSAPSSVDLFNTFSQFIFGFQADYLNTIIVSTWPIVVLFAFYALQKNRKVSDEVVFIVAAATIPVLAAFFVSILIRPFYLSRYLIVALPALMIFIAWTISNYPKRTAFILRGLLVAAITAGLIIQIVSPAAPIKEDYKGVSTYLNEKASASDVIATSAPFTIYPIEYYYRGQAQLTTIPVWNRFEPGGLPPFEKAKLPEYAKTVNGSSRNVWLVLSVDQGYQDDIYQYYAGKYRLLEKKKFASDIMVYKYQLRYDPTLPAVSAEAP